MGRVILRCREETDFLRGRVRKGVEVEVTVELRWGVSEGRGGREGREEGVLPVPAHTHFYHRMGRPSQRHRGDCPRAAPLSPRG